MAASSTPELVVPGQLYIPDGKVGYSIAADSMPNGDNSLLITNTAGANEFQAYQDAHANHLLGADPCALSFWIKRRQFFGGSTMNSSYRSDPVDTSDKMIMGVVDPLLSGSLTYPAEGKISWGIFSYSSRYIQFLANGKLNSTSNWDIHGAVDLPLVDTWYFVVVNRTRAALTTAPTPDEHGHTLMYVNGTLASGNSSSLWSYMADVDYSTHRFSLGDGTLRGLTEIGAAAGAGWEIGHLAFHNRMLTNTDMLGMIESMNYGPES